MLFKDLLHEKLNSVLDLHDIELIEEDIELMNPSFLISTLKWQHYSNTAETQYQVLQQHYKSIDSHHQQTIEELKRKIHQIDMDLLSQASKKL